MHADADVIVAGGGISGLASAWYLHRRGLRVLVLEAASQAGGTLRTLRARGCLLESGPNSALENTPLIPPLLAELGIEGERIAPRLAARNRYVVRGGKLHALPLSPGAFVATRLFSARAKLRLLCEPFIARGPADADESVAGFIKRRLGSELLDYCVDPFVGGVYAGDPSHLSVRAAFPRWREFEQRDGSLLRGFIRAARERRREGDSPPRTVPMFAFRDGMQVLTDAIARRLPRVATAMRVTRVMRAQGGYLVGCSGAGGVRELRARAAILAVPAYAAADTVSRLAPEASHVLKSIEYAPLAVVHSAYRRCAIAHSLDGFGMLLPRCERRNILGTIFSSTLFENRAPGGVALLTTFLAGMRDPHLAQLSETKLAQLAHREHETLLGAGASPESTWCTTWPRAIPQYTHGHLGRIAELEHTERAFPGLFFCANYRGGVSMGDCIRSANDVAERALAI